MPFVALTTSYVYFDARVREALEPAQERPICPPRSSSPAEGASPQVAGAAPLSEDAATVDITIVISNYAPKGRLLSCIDHALSQDAGAGEYEVVFPLHGEITDSELEQLHARAAGTGRLRLLSGERHNRARALNDAVSSAASECLMFLESHVHAPPDLAAHYRRLLRSADVAAVQGAYAAAASRNWAWEAESGLRARGGGRRRARGLPADEFHLHSAGFQRHALLAAGGFDERVPGIAEVPLLQRIQESGGRIVFLEAPVVDHANESDFHTYARALRRRGREIGVLWRLDPGMASRIYPAAVVERHGALIRRAHRPLHVACEVQLSLALLILRLSRALRLHRVVLPAAAALASTAIRAGFLEGYCESTHRQDAVEEHR